MGCWRFILSMLAYVLLLGAIHLHATNADGSADSTLPLAWLTQKVWVNNRTVIYADPYIDIRGTYPNATLRSLNVDENLPYFKHDSTSSNANGTLRHDAIHTIDILGNDLYLYVFDQIDGQKNSDGYYDGNINDPDNGYSIDQVKGMDTNKWVSCSSTKKGPSGAQIWFGQINNTGNPTPYNGWIWFPASAVTNSGGFQTNFQYSTQPLQGWNWEESGGPWSTNAPPTLSTLPSYLTTPFPDNNETGYRFITNCPFGGYGIASKNIDAIQCVHGYVTTNNPTAHASFMSDGHLEVAYFTQPYGQTRWETWRPIQQLANGYGKDSAATVQTQAFAMAAKVSQVSLAPAQNESLQPYTYTGPTGGGYTNGSSYSYIRGIYWGSDRDHNDYAVTAAWDVSAVTPYSSPMAPPIYPITDQDLLSNFRFDDTGEGGTQGWVLNGVTGSVTNQRRHRTLKSTKIQMAQAACTT